MIQHFVSHSKCRLCDSGNIEQVIDLGYSPLANAYLTETQLKDVRSGALEEIFTPLRCFLCMDCGSVQLEHSVDPKVLFTDYQYASSTSPVFVKHFVDLANHIQDLGLIEPFDLVVDIGSNDGIALAPFKTKGQNVLGIEPSEQLAQMARAKGIQTIQQFLNMETAKAIVGAVGKAKVVTATNVFAHVSDLPRFVEAVLELLDDDGVFIIEVSYLADVIENMLFDTIYVEHQFYHSLRPLVGFFYRFGLHVFRAERISTHGGSIRLFVKRGTVQSETIDAWIQHEWVRGLFKPQTYRDFTDRIQAYKHRLHSVLRQFNRRAGTYGCPAKFTTFCYALELNDQIGFVLEDSPLKIGKFTPGSHHHIQAVSGVGHVAILVSAWNFFDSIYERHRGSMLAYDWIRPLPKLEVVSGL